MSDPEGFTGFLLGFQREKASKKENPNSKKMKTTRSTVTFSAQALTRGRNRSRHRRSFYDTAIFGWAPLFALSLQKHFSLSLSKMFFIFSFFLAIERNEVVGRKRGIPPKPLLGPFLFEKMCVYFQLFIFSAK